MSLSLRIGILTGLVAAAFCLAQTAGTPPAEVDAALRDRINKFYQAHVDGKYRQAEQYIAEENRDDFYNNAKTKYTTVGESKIEYSDNFTKATAHTKAKMIWRVARGEMELNKEVESFWKLENGQWYWYQPPGYGMMTPFSPDGKGARMQPQPSASKPGTGESIGDKVKNFDKSALTKVEISKSDIRLSKKGGAKDSVAVKNGLSGVVVVQVDHDDLPGLEIKVTPEQVKPGESAIVEFSYNPPKPEADPQIRAKIVIQPTLQAFPLGVQFVDDAQTDSKRAK